MPKSRGNKENNLLKAALKNQLHSEEDASPRLTRASAKSKSFANATPSDKVLTESSTDDTDTNKTLPASIAKVPKKTTITASAATTAMTRKKKKGSKGRVINNTSNNDVVSSANLTTTLTTSTTTTTSADEEEKMELDSVPADEKQNFAEKTAALSHTRQHNDIQTNHSSEEEKGESFPPLVKPPKGLRKSLGRKSIDHAAKRKSLIARFSTYSREELTTALLTSQDCLTDYQMKYSCIKQEIQKMLTTDTMPQIIPAKYNAFMHEREELLQKVEFEKFTREDNEAKIKELQGKQHELQTEVLALQNVNTEMLHKNKEEVKMLERAKCELAERLSSQTAELRELQAERSAETEKRNEQKCAEDLQHAEKITGAEEKIAQLEQMNSEAVDERNIIRAEVDTLKQHLAEERKEKDAIVAEKQQLVEQVVEMEASKMRLEKEAGDLGAQFAEAKVLNEQFAVKVQGLLDLVADKDTINRDSHDHNNILKEENTKLEDEIANLKAYQTELVEKHSEYIEEQKRKGRDIMEMLTTDESEPMNYSFMKDSVRKFLIQNSDEENLQLLSVYKNLILDLQDVMDFYSLLSGISIWKTDDSKSQSDIIQYHCQLNPALLDEAVSYRFVITMDCNEGTVTYECDDENVDSLKGYLPSCLSKSLTIKDIHAFTFLRNLLQESAAKTTTTTEGSELELES